MYHSRIGRQLVCKMAMLLALIFAACSNDTSPSTLAHEGGYTEETGIYALSGRVGDVYPKLMKIADSTGKIIDSMGYEGSLYAPKGAVISVQELDSLTFDTTGRVFVDTVDNDSGHFSFKEMELKSPYVLIRESNCPPDTLKISKFSDPVYANSNYSAIVDLRNASKVSVSALTSAKVPLVREYLAEGKTFADASKMAELAILDSLGIYEDLGDFEQMGGEDSELSYANKLYQWDNAGRTPSWSFIRSIPLLFAPPKTFSTKGAEVEQYYLSSIKMIQYEIGFFARKNNLGRCTESRENETGSFKANDTVYVVCRSGKWTIGFKPIEYTKGTMEDARDGKTYKTVTYNFNGTSQTWMAENLDFTDTNSLSADNPLRKNLSGNISCYQEEHKTRDCEDYGHAYQWAAAMNIDEDEIKMYSINNNDTVPASRRCVEAYLNRLDSESTKAISDSCDTLLLGENTTIEDEFTRTWSWNYTDFITPSNQNSYQGVCPDGWRIPTWDDWKTLLENLGEQYDVYYGNAVPVLYDDAATGFGLKSTVRVKEDNLNEMYISYADPYFNSFVMANIPLYSMEVFNAWHALQGFHLNFPTTWHHTIILADTGYAAEWDDTGIPYGRRPGAVRCIKN